MGERRVPYIVAERGYAEFQTQFFVKHDAGRLEVKTYGSLGKVRKCLLRVRIDPERMRKSRMFCRWENVGGKAHLLNVSKSLKFARVNYPHNLWRNAD